MGRRGVIASMLSRRGFRSLWQIVLTAEDKDLEEYYFWEMAVAKAPGMFRPYKGKPVKVQEKKEENREPSATGEFTVGIITGVVLALVVRRMLCGRSPRLRG